MNFKKYKNKFIYFILKWIPYFILRPFFCILLFFVKKEIKNIKINSKKTSSKKNLIYVDYNGAIGDFIIIIRTIYYLSIEFDNFDVLAPKKLSNILEKLNLKNINIIYKENNIGTHYKEFDNKIDFMKIYNESKSLNLSYDKIYYFNKAIIIDTLIYLSNVNYNELICMKNVYDKGFKNNLFFIKGINPLSIFYFVNKKKMKIKYVGTKKQKHLFLADYSYWIYAKKNPNIRLSEIDISKYFIERKTNNNKTLALILDKYPRNKALRIDKLCAFIKQNYFDYTLYLYGDSLKQAKYIIENTDNKINNLVGKTKYIWELINSLSNCNYALTYDTSLLHISTLLKIETTLVINENHYVYKNEKNCWLSYEKVKKIIKSKDDFTDIVDENNNMLN